MPGGELRTVLAEQRRGIILRTLSDQDAFTLNEGVLQDALERLGHPVARDIVRDDLAWLQDHQLVTTAEVGRLTVATLTQRGEDCAAGRARVPGVKRPDPKG